MSTSKLNAYKWIADVTTIETRQQQRQRKRRYYAYLDANGNEVDEAGFNVVAADSDSEDDY